MEPPSLFQTTWFLKLAAQLVAQFLLVLYFLKYGSTLLTFFCINEESIVTLSPNLISDTRNSMTKMGHFGLSS